MKKALMILSAAMLAVGIGVAQERGGGPKPCDMKSLEKGLWCSKCDKLLGKDDLNDEKKCKAEGCGEKPVEVEVCVKERYTAPCHPEKELKAGGS